LLGAFELRGELNTQDSSKKDVSQWIRLTDGTYDVHPVGTFEYHEGTHNDFHFEGYARYTLQRVDAPGGSAIEGAKVSFCIVDNTKVNTRPTETPRKAVYTTCGADVQGMSVGRDDTYRRYLDGQSLPFGDNPSGRYLLKIEVDPNSKLLESDRSTISRAHSLRLTLTSLRAFGAGDRDQLRVFGVTVTGITPNSLRAGSSGPVVIAGSGFAPGTKVSFENGSGKTPTASNVLVKSDGTSITATVTVSNGGSSADPVWDLRVGPVLIPNAFTVIR
jgi:hypothetical protein